MMFRWFAPTSREANIDSLYGTIVAQARNPAFYQSYGVPDTVTARLEMIMLHAILVLRRLKDHTGSGRELGQRLFDRFCQDMDDNMREMGVGDLAVPGKMRLIGEAFYGRQAAYTAALAAPHADGLAEALARNVFAGCSGPERATRLAAYCRETLRQLNTQGELTCGEVSFPDPQQVGVHA